MATWVSVDPRNGQTVPYDAETSFELEAAFSSGVAQLELLLEGRKYTVRFKEMRQYNASGGCREVRRLGPMRSMELSFDSKVFAMAMETVDTVDQQLAKLHQEISNRHFRWRNVDEIRVLPILQVYEWILELLSAPQVVERFGGNSADVLLCHSRLGQPVPQYFANFSDGSIYRRKILSVLGLRNLVYYGGDIFNDLLVKQFSGNVADYAERTGLSKMKYFTGNTVDLDTVVLNVSQQWREVCTMFAGEKQFRTQEEFEKDPRCKQLVHHQAQCLVDSFIETMKLSAREIAGRNVSLDPKEDIHVATNNSDRGRYPVWHYRNGNVSTFHVNVPNINDIIGALLAAPFHLVKGFVLSMTQESNGKEKMLLEFFEDCVSDSCFNGKWKSIEAFVDKWSTYDDIPIVISRLQEKFQERFRGKIGGENRDGEANELVTIIREVKAAGIDPKTKAKRLITEQDVQNWIQATNDC